MYYSIHFVTKTYEYDGWLLHAVHVIYCFISHIYMITQEQGVFAPFTCKMHLVFCKRLCKKKENWYKNMFVLLFGEWVGLECLSGGPNQTSFGPQATLWAALFHDIAIKGPFQQERFLLYSISHSKNVYIAAEGLQFGNRGPRQLRRFHSQLWISPSCSRCRSPWSPPPLCHWCSCCSGHCTPVQESNVSVTQHCKMRRTFGKVASF